MTTTNRTVSTDRIVAVLAVLGALFAAGAFVGGVVADDHTHQEAPHYGPDEKGNATFEFLEREDHYPGARDVEVRYTQKGGDVYEDVGATDGVAADRFVVETDAVDHSDCDSENVATFGVDEDGDGEYDVDLLQYTKTAMYFDDGIVVEFYDYEDFGGDPPVVHADDRIVLELSDDAAGGACADTTEEVGFYNAETFLNGTGPMEANRTDEQYGFTIESEYTYVCECEDEEEAREQIGYDPTTPTGTPSGTATATPTPTETPTPTPTERPRTPTPDGTPVLTATVDESVGDANVSANASVGTDGGSVDVSAEAGGGDDDHLSDPPSPTPADAPGFGAGVAVVALLCSTLLARRRWT